MVVLLEFCRSNGEISVFGPLPGSPCARASGHQARPEVSRAPEEICFLIGIIPVMKNENEKKLTPPTRPLNIYIYNDIWRYHRDKQNNIGFKLFEQRCHVKWFCVSKWGIPNMENDDRSG